MAPILWILYAVVVLRESTWRHALGTTLRIGVLTLGACLWWIAGLEVEAAYGVNVLKYTETVPSTSATSNAADIIRGLGYWYFYGTDHTGPWTTAAIRYTQDVWLLATSYAVPVLALVAAAFVRWRERAFFLVLLFVGLILSVGPFPFGDPTTVGKALKSFMTDTTAGLALRSTDRATPLVLLALCMLLGSGLSALWSRLHVAGLVTAILVAGLVVANNPSLFLGDFVANGFTQPASLPSYQLAAIKHLNATHPGTRVFAIPGNDFAAYRWGDTVDTPQSAFLNRDFITREQQIMGSIATADTLYATDGPIQDGTANMNALAPMARLMGAGDLMVEYDQQYERYGVPQPQLLALQLLQTPLGLTDPVSFGTPRPNISSVSTLNEQDLAVPGNVGWPSPIVTYTVPDPRAMLRGESDSGAVLMEGDATGLDNLAGLGMLDTDSAIYYAGTLAKQPAQLQSLASQGAQLVLTDTNRKQAFRWDTLTANSGYTETPSDEPGQERPERQPDRALPRHGHHDQDLRHVRRRRERDGQQLRQLGLLHARGPGLQRHRPELRHGLDHGHLRAGPQGPVVAVAVRQPGHHRPHHPGPAPARRPLPLGLEGHAHLRRQGPRHLRAQPLVPRHGRPDADLPLPDVPHAAGDDRRHDRRHGDAGRGVGGRLLRGGDPGPAGAPGAADADPDAHQSRRGVRRRPPQRGDDPAAHLPVPAAQRSRDDDLAPVHPAHGAHLHALGQRQPVGADPRRRGRPPRRPRHHPVEHGAGRLLVGPPARATSRRRRRPRSTATRRPPGSRDWAARRRWAPR